MDKPHAIIIGAGFTGSAAAYDLALRGFQVTVAERGEIASGTSGRTHGLLHSGARYCVHDPESAVECVTENAVLRRIAAQCIEPNGGMFVAVDDSDLEYKDAFLKGAAKSCIPVEEISPEEALRLEPNLNPRLKAAVLVPDGSFDPLRMALAFAASAQAYGAKFLTYTEVLGLIFDGQRRVSGIEAWDRKSDRRFELRGDITISAAGSWAGKIAAMGDADVPIVPTPGVMVAYDRRLTERSINRLNEPGDGDIAIPQRRMTVVGTTSFEVEDLDYIPVFEHQVRSMLERGAELIPGLRSCKMRGAYMSSRPLIGAGASARSMCRTFKCFDHTQTDGVDCFVTITGGKATTCRLMAEQTVDLVCKKMGSTASCTTREMPLRSYRDFVYD